MPSLGVDGTRKACAGVGRWWETMGGHDKMVEAVGQVLASVGKGSWRGAPRGGANAETSLGVGAEPTTNKGGAGASGLNARGSCGGLSKGAAEMGVITCPWGGVP
jgi:hypothetical protein